MIALENLVKSFAGAKALDVPALVVPRGQRIALIGSNGAGKTTLFRCLLGEYTHEGSVRVAGRDPRRARAAVLGRVGFVPQIAPRLEMPVGALVRYVADLTGARTQDISAVAQALGLDVAAIARRPFVKLSGGMKQKLLIALALGRPVQLLIMDEPAANLDPAARAVLFAMLAERAAEATMVISSHRIDEIAGLVNRVIELDQGRIALDDTINDAGALGSHFAVAVEALRPEPSFARAAAEWGFLETAPGHWAGRIAGPERLRFFGFVARHAGLVGAVHVAEAPAERQEVRHAV